MANTLLSACETNNQLPSAPFESFELSSQGGSSLVVLDEPSDAESALMVALAFAVTVFLLAIDAEVGFGKYSAHDAGEESEPSMAEANKAETEKTVSTKGQPWATEQMRNGGQTGARAGTAA